MKKPFYKRWIFWIIVIIVGGIIGLTTGNDNPVNQADPADAQPAVANPTTEPTAVPTEAPTEGPTATEKPQVEVPAYNIVEQRLDDSGMWYLTLSTEATDAEQLRALVEYGYIMAVYEKNGATSMFINIKNPGSSVYVAKGKLALSDKGVAQTGLSSTNAVEFEMLK